MKPKNLLQKWFTLTCAATFLLLLLALVKNIAAQPTNGPSNDPPARVAQLNYIDGTVTFKKASSHDWAYAQLNRPLTSGDQLWADKNSRSELHIGSTALRLKQQTAMEIANLDNGNVQLKLTQGTLSLHIRTLPPGQSYEINTPNLAMQITSPGVFRVDVAAEGSSTTVTVRAGDASVSGNGDIRVQIGENQRIRFIGTNLQQTERDATPALDLDAFDRWAAQRDDAEDQSVSARYLSREIPGYQALDTDGTWREDPTYGNIWIPHVAVSSGWTPYRTGHWTWIAPWGWTWIDDARWGFAPFHYGRWAYIDGTWAWVPGPRLISVQPVYAPALVAFAGGSQSHSSWHINLSIGGAVSSGVAWFPLAPGELWRPAYSASSTYIKNVNQTTIINNIHNNIHNNIKNNIHNDIHKTYVNQHVPGAITAVPTKAFVQGHLVQRIAQTLHPEQIAHAPIGASAPALTPVNASAGLRKTTVQPLAAIKNRQVITTRSPAPSASVHHNASTMLQDHAPGGPENHNHSGVPHPPSQDIVSGKKSQLKSQSQQSQQSQSTQSVSHPNPHRNDDSEYRGAGAEQPMNNHLDANDVKGRESSEYRQWEHLGNEHKQHKQKDGNIPPMSPIHGGHRDGGHLNHHNERHEGHHHDAR